MNKQLFGSLWQHILCYCFELAWDGQYVTDLTTLHVCFLIACYDTMVQCIMINIDQCMRLAQGCSCTCRPWGAMATPAFRQSFARFPEVPIKQAMEKTVVKIIDLDHEKKDVNSIKWVRELSAHGINISYLSNPCQLYDTIGGNPTISTIEVRHCFSPWMWARVTETKSAGAICISHLRALNECLSQNPSANTIVILEGDVTEHENTQNLMSAFLANWHGNEALKYTRYCALTFSDWHAGYSQTLRGSPDTVPNSIVAPYFKILALPMKKFGSQSDWKYQFVGQGARAIVYERSFAEKVVGEKVGNFWDMHLLDLLSRESNEEWGASSRKYHKYKAVVVDPPIFAHVPSFDKRFRGSGRLEGKAVNEAEETSYYITLSLNHEWGLVNRLQTICLVGAIAGLYRVGLYILWEPKKACPGKFSDTNCFDTSSEAYQSIPFVKLFDDPKNSDWKAARNNQHWCICHVESQCQVEMGLDFLWARAEEKATKDGDAHFLKAILPQLKARIDSDFCWQLVNVNDDIYKKAYDYMEESRTGGGNQIGVHCRRGDHKYMNCDAHVDEQKQGAFEIQCQWEDGDGELQEIILGTLLQYFFLFGFG